VEKKTGTENESGDQGGEANEKVEGEESTDETQEEVK